MMGWMRRGRSTAPPAMRKPVDAMTGAPFLRKFMVKLFDREDGKAADWPMIAQTLLAEAFHALDQAPDDPRILSLELCGILGDAAVRRRDLRCGRGPRSRPRK